MSGHTKNRKRNKDMAVAFWATEEEKREIEMRFACCGMPKGQYVIQCLLHQKIEITAGRYKSDRLAVEMKRLREQLDRTELTDDEAYWILVDCRALIRQLISIIEANGNTSGEL